MKPRNFTALLVAILVSTASAQPSSEDQARVLEAVRAAALKYSRQLPDFICTQITHRDVSKGNSSYLNANNVAPRPLPVSNDTIEEQLTYYGGKESYSLPSRSEMRMEDSTQVYSNEIEFKNYHHFSSESTIHVGGVAPQ